jgi:hypothetical protein
MENLNMSIEEKDIVSVKKVENENYDGKTDINKFDIIVEMGNMNLIFSNKALLKIKLEFEEILKNDFYSGDQDKRLYKLIEK